MFFIICRYMTLVMNFMETFAYLTINFLKVEVTDIAFIS